MSFEDSNDDKTYTPWCKLAASMKYEISWGIVGKLLNALLIGRIVCGSTRDVVLGTKGYYETGKQLDMGDLSFKEI